MNTMIQSAGSRLVVRGKLLLVALMVAVVSVPLVFPLSATAATCDTWQSATWGRAWACRSTSGYAYGQVDDTRTDGHCVYMKYYGSESGGWVTIPNSKSCGSVVSWNNISREIIDDGIRMYREDGRYLTICANYAACD